MGKKANNAAAREKWVCPSCKHKVRTAFCSACGEASPRERDLKLHGLFVQLFQAFSTVDGRLIPTLRYLVTKPGVLTMAYIHGRRVPYLGPFQLFLIANVIFFAMQSLTNTNIVSSNLDSHLNIQDWSALAQRLVSHHLESAAMSLEAYAPVFNQAVVLLGKSLIVVMVLPFSILLVILSYRSQRPVVTHVIFSLHFYAFLLLLFCVLLIVAEVDVLFGGTGLNSPRLDSVLSLVSLGACFVYLYAALGVVYGSKRSVRALKALLLAMSVTGILLGYRFLLFLFTLYTT